MSFSTWVDTRLSNFAPVLAPLLAKAIVDDAAPQMQQLENMLSNKGDQLEAT